LRHDARDEHAQYKTPTWDSLTRAGNQQPQKDKFKRTKAEKRLAIQPSTNWVGNIGKKPERRQGRKRRKKGGKGKKKKKKIKKESKKQEKSRGRMLNDRSG